jgi:prepilin peptidase CpaA
MSVYLQAAVGTMCALLILAAFIDCWKLKVPNWLTFSMVLSGWALGLGWGGLSGLWASFALTWVGFALLFPVYAIGGMGAGDVKMQMGFGAWVGAIWGLGEGFWIVIYGFCLAAMIGGVIAAGMIVYRGDFRRNKSNTLEIVGDFVNSGSVQEVADKASARKPRMHLLPYGLPLCIGFLSYLCLRNYPTGF